MPIDISALYPHLALSAGGLLLLLTALLPGRRGEALGVPLTILTFLVSLALLPAAASAGARTAFGGALVVDGFGLFFAGLCILASLFTFLLSIRYIREGEWGLVEYGAILVFATAGMLFMVTSQNLIAIYIGLELMALSSYVLASFSRDEEKSFEAGFKYFILGAFSSGMLLYGMSLLYGTTGTLDLATLVSRVGSDDRILLAGVVLMAAGLLFKIAAVPFHIWTPDVYEGAPTPITAFFSIGPKAAGFAIFLRIFVYAFAPMTETWTLLIGLSAVLTMVFGNLVALVQKNIKRMLAYSSIAHAGYALLGILAHSKLGTKGVLLYMLAYLFMNMGAFGMVVYLQAREYAGEMISDFKGLGRSHPFLAFCMLIFMFSLAGIPATAGFVGKFFLFAAAVKAGYVLIAVIGVIMSAISLYYYLGPVVAMYQYETEEHFTMPLRRHWGISLTVLICLVGTLFIGLAPNRVIELLSRALLPMV